MKRTLVTLLLGGLVWSTCASQKDPISYAAAAVVQIKANDCGGSNRIASGFLWRDSKTVVTAAHVVAGCKVILVYSEKSRQPDMQGSVERILPSADLVLLHLPKAVSIAPFLKTASVQPLETLYSFGYPLGIPKLISTTLSVRIGGKMLRDIVPESVRKSLVSAGAPSVEIEVLNLQGPLQMGTSGSPVFDSEGRLVGIADGGLELGAASASWAIPQRYIKDLEIAPKATLGGSPNPNLFAAEQESTIVQVVTCGSEKLARVRSRPYTRLLASADDPDRLEQLIVTSYIEPSEFTFDIYQHIESGATIAFPKGTVLHSEGNHCKGESGTERVDYVLGIASFKDKFDLQGKTADFESDLIPDHEHWVTDSTVATPLKRRFDGLLVTRKGAAHVKDMKEIDKPDEYMFETLAARNGYVLMLFTIDHWSTGERRNKDYQCARFGQTAPECFEVLQSYKLWVASVLGAELTTFIAN